MTSQSRQQTDREIEIEAVVMLKRLATRPGLLSYSPVVQSLGLRVYAHSAGGVEAIGQLSESIYSAFILPGWVGVTRGLARGGRAEAEERRLRVADHFKALSEARRLRAAIEGGVDGGGCGWIHLGRFEIDEGWRGRGVGTFALRELIDSIGNDCIITAEIPDGIGQAAANFGLDNPIMVDGRIYQWADTQTRDFGHKGDPLWL